MTLPERVKADYEVMDLTTGPHPMKLVREQLADIWRATDLVQARHGSIIQIAGNVICRQRPGTAKGFVFISLEDETGVSNAIVTPDLFEQRRLLITEEPFLMIEGEVQNSDNVVLIKAQKSNRSCTNNLSERVARFSLVPLISRMPFAFGSESSEDRLPPVKSTP